MEHIRPVHNDINLCFACNNNYAVPLRTMIYSVLKNAARNRCYDIIILHNDIAQEHIDKIMRFGKENVSVRFIDMSEFHKTVEDNRFSYISAETCYRLFLFSQMFAQYDRILYLDCDMQAVDDIAKLYDTDLEGMAVGACEEASFRMYSLSKHSVFFDNMPSNVDYYRQNLLKLEKPDEYFNAGMLLIDLKKAREITDENKAIGILNEHKMQFMDQDVLNILFNGRVKLLDIRWNYSIVIPFGLEPYTKEWTRVFTSLKRKSHGIVHYTGSLKPWNAEVPLGEIYEKNFNRITKEEIQNDK